MKKYKAIEGKRLIGYMLKHKFKCPNCNHRFNKKECGYVLTDNEDNQDCPKCGYFIS